MLSEIPERVSDSKVNDYQAECKCAHTHTWRFGCLYLFPTKQFYMFCCQDIMKPCEQALVKLGLKIRLQQASAKQRS